MSQDALAAKQDELYAHQARSLETTLNIGAAAISLLITLSVADDPYKLASAIALHVTVVPMNVAWARLVVPRYGPRSEVVRTIINQVLCTIGYTLIGWPLPVWLWLPFAGLAFDQWGRKHTLIVMVIMCAFQGTAGIVYGVSPLYPLTFTALAIICWSLATRRLQVIREMLVRSELQRVELERAHMKLKAEIAAREAVEVELRQAQKLEAIGRLSAGVAHEINTPMQFIGDSLKFVSESVDDLLSLCQRYLSVSTVSAEHREAALRRAIEYGSEIDIEFLAAELPGAVALIADGVGRVTTIVRSMKLFAHHGSERVGTFKIDDAIETTLAIAKHEYKLVADVERHLSDTPPIIGDQGEINQLLLNIIVNAAHAIEDVVGSSGKRGRITIRTAIEGSSVRISVTDTGTGIPETVRARIFDPFFTTKDVGRGSGQGLAISRGVVERHGGELTFETETGRGTTFHIRLPIRGPSLLAA